MIICVLLHTELYIDYTCVSAHRTLGCGNHVCEDLCHPGVCGVCPLLPQQVTHCCCGQTPLVALTIEPRSSCLDPVPTCDKTCNKPMACGPTGKPRISYHQICIQILRVTKGAAELRKKDVLVFLPLKSFIRMQNLQKYWQKNFFFWGGGRGVGRVSGG